MSLIIFITLALLAIVALFSFSVKTDEFCASNLMPLAEAYESKENPVKTMIPAIPTQVLSPVPPNQPLTMTVPPLTTDYTTNPATQAAMNFSSEAPPPPPMDYTAYPVQPTEEAPALRFTA